MQFHGVPEAIATWLIRAGDGWMMVDCGPSTTQKTLIDNVTALGIDMCEVTRIVLTHIHLDHGGAAGTLMRDYPHLRLTVHADAAQTMIDPARLIRSARMSFGERMQTLWGEIIGVEADRIDPISAGEMVPSSRLWAIATPGHSGTHLSFLDLDDGVLYAGDAAHARLPNSNVIIPTLAPIELDFDAWQATAIKMRSVHPTALALPHFGYVPDPVCHLAMVEARIITRIAVAERNVRSLQDGDALTAAIHELSLKEFDAEGAAERLESMELAMPSYLGSQGLLRWYKVHGVLLSPPTEFGVGTTR